MTARRTRQLRATAGFTLVEALFCVVIVSGLLLAASRAFGAIARARQVQMDRTLGFGLADQLLTEVMQCYFKEPAGGTTLGPDAGETSRAQFDDCDDYNGWSESPPQLRDGTVLTEFTGWTRSVSVTCVRPDAPNIAAGATDTQRLK